MAYAFGGNRAVCVFEEPRELDPVQFARREMAAYDQLPPEVRAAFAGSLYGVPVVETFETVTRRGAEDEVKRRLRDKGLMPCDVGTEGVVVETIRIRDERETTRIRSELGI